MDDKKNTEATNLITCLNCGKVFNPGTRRGNIKYCSENCRNAFYGYKSSKSQNKEITSLMKVCAFCQKEFECSSITPTRRFCSYNCSKAFQKSKQIQQPNAEKESIQEKRNCLYCGKEFIWSNSKPIQKYCSIECAEKANKDKYKKKSVQTEKRNCAYCSREFEWSSFKPSQKYCSIECRQIATSISSKRYSKRYSKNNKNSDEQLRNEIYLKVLDIISKSNQSKGNTFGNRYINYWQTGSISEKTRDEVLERDGFECQICRRKDSLHLHHLIKRTNGGDHSPANLITLCDSCHRHIETGDIEHATNTCLKNAKRYYGEKENNKSIETHDLRAKLTLLFDKLKASSVANDEEIMVCLDEAIDMIDV